MNALFLSTKVPYPAKDGGALGTVTFVSQLRSLGYRVTILSANTPKHFTNLEANSESEPDLIAVPVNTRISFLHLLLNLLFSKKPYLVTRFYNSRFKKELTRLLLTQSYNVIQLEGSQMGIYLSLIRNIVNTPVILRAHNIEYMLWENISSTEKSPLKKLYLRIQAKRYQNFEKALYRKVDFILPVSPVDEQIIRKIASVDKICTISFAVNTDKVHEKPIDNNAIFYIGALDWIPNQQGLIWFLEKVWPVVLTKFPDLTFHIAGRNAPNWLQERLHVKNICFYGEVDDADTFASQFKIMVVPVLSGSGIRIKILEAMAMKKAIVTTSKGAEGLDINHTELKIADSPKEFINNLSELIMNVGLQKTMGDEAFSFVLNNFSISCYKKKIEDCYKQVILG